ncbi:MAG: malate synthase G, partial [Pseudomonadota bacterium]
MTSPTQIAGLTVAPELAAFIADEALPGTGIDAATFWEGLGQIMSDLGPKNRALLEKRAALQAQIDDWHLRHRNQPHSHDAYTAFLHEIGYLLPEGDDFEIETQN